MGELPHSIERRKRKERGARDLEGGRWGRVEIRKEKWVGKGVERRERKNMDGGREEGREGGGGKGDGEGEGEKEVRVEKGAAREKGE